MIQTYLSRPGNTASSSVCDRVRSVANSALTTVRPNNGHKHLNFESKFPSPATIPKLGGGVSECRDQLKVADVVSKLLRQLGFFCVIGGIGFVIDASILYTTRPAYGPYLAQVLAFPPAVLATWALNRRFTFSYRLRISIREIVGYLCGNVAGWVAVNGIYFALISLSTMGREHPIGVLGCGALCGALLNFFILRYWAFRPRDYDANKRSGTTG